MVLNFVFVLALPPLVSSGLPSASKSLVVTFLAKGMVFACLC